MIEEMRPRFDLLSANRVVTMPETKPFTCQNCGHQFAEQVLTKEESQRARDENRPTSSLHCPKCNRTAVRPGWD